MKTYLIELILCALFSATFTYGDTATLASVSATYPTNSLGEPVELVFTFTNSGSNVSMYNLGWNDGVDNVEITVTDGSGQRLPMLTPSNQLISGPQTLRMIVVHPQESRNVFFVLDRIVSFDKEGQYWITVKEKLGRRTEFTTGVVINTLKDRTNSLKSKYAALWHAYCSENAPDDYFRASELLAYTWNEVALDYQKQILAKGRYPEVWRHIIQSLLKMKSGQGVEHLLHEVLPRKDLDRTTRAIILYEIRIADLPKRDPKIAELISPYISEIQSARPIY